jgi:hypothetical protein
MAPQHDEMQLSMPSNVIVAKSERSAA